jgi:hypothetical protein
MVNLLLRPDRFPSSSRTIGKAYLSRYWRPDTPAEWFDIAVAILIWPIAIIITAFWFTMKNGSIVAKRFGRSRLSQLGDVLRLAVTSGLLPPWYYIFELYRPGKIDEARWYLTRGQTKRGVYCILSEARGSCSPLSDKEDFARHCANANVDALPVLLSVHDGELRGRIRAADHLPRTDLFVKPVRGRGGRGAERWDHLGNGLYRHTSGELLNAQEFLERLRRKSRSQPYLVQERVVNHPAMDDLTNGALSTVRMITCLDEQDRPEIMGAVLRMAVGSNVTVDNVHAGGLAAAVDLSEGRLLKATDMGFDAHLGWSDRHPDTQGRIAGRALPMWSETCDLVKRAHRAFGDRVLVGWDVAILIDGPRIVEGNSSPDIDLVQRPLRMAFGNGRFGELLAHHLERSKERTA